jgi:single-strand DNA-binding protein
VAPLNRCEFIGYVGKDPDLQVTADGTPFTRFSLAVSLGKDQKPMWLNIVCWRELAELMEQYLHKGSFVFIEGKLQIRPYKDKAGSERTAVDIVATNVQVLDKKQSDEMKVDEEQGPFDIPPV